jgi:hypothetical protein
MFLTTLDLIRYDSKLVAIFESAQSREFTERLFNQENLK